MNIQTLAMALPSRNPQRYARWSDENIRLYTPMHERALFFRTRVGGVRLEGGDYIRTNAEGRVTEFSVLLRPLDAITTLSKAIGARMQEAGASSPDTPK